MREPHKSLQPIQLCQLRDIILREHQRREVRQALAQARLDRMNSISRQQQRPQPVREREVAKSRDIVVCEIDRFVLVLRDAEVLDGGNLVTF